MKKLLTIIIIILHPLVSVAQTTISGYVFDTNQQPVPFADIVLQDIATKGAAAFSASDEKGYFEITTEKIGSYEIQISSIGFELFITNVLNLEGDKAIVLENLVLTESSFALNEVSIEGKKAPIKRAIDRTIINIEDDATVQGSSILDIMERTPGIIVDRENESISVLGKSGVNIMINGKMNYMPASALVQFLNGINAENAKSIELITTPPSKFDAAGNAGYINIELNKRTDVGFNGNFNTALGYAKEKARKNIGTSFNVTGEKSSLSFNYSLLDNQLPITGRLSRSLIVNEQPLTTTVDAVRENNRLVHNLSFSYDQKLSEQFTLGTTVTGYSNNYRMIEYKNATHSNEPFFDDYYETTENNLWKNVQSSVYLNYQWEESKLDFAVDYLKFGNDQPVDYFVNLVSPQSVSDLNFNSTKSSPFTISVFSTDFENKFKENVRFSAGLKYVVNDFTNTNYLYREEIMDNRFSNSSQLDEKIGAAYSQLNFPLSEKVKVQAGLRYEFTQTQVNSLIDNSVFVDREYGNFFPSVFLSYKINDFNNLNLSSSRRINRPSFTDMAPFVFFVDLEQAFEGNVSLKPSYTNNFQLDYRYKSVNLTVQYTDEKDVISRFQPSIDSSSGFVTIRPANVDEQQTLSTIISYSFYPVSFWNLRLFSTFAYTALKNNVAESSIDITNSSLRFNMNNNFNLGNDFSFQVWGYYNSRAVSGINIVLPAGALNLALQKKYKNFTYTLNATNILDTQRWRFESINTAQNFYQDFDVNFSPPQIRFAVSTSFGNQKIKQKQLRKSEEASRVNL